MSLLLPSQELSDSLQNPMWSSGHKTIRVTYGGGDHLNISLRRTIRVPENGPSYNPRPDCGPFPIYSVNEYKEKLPKTMAGKGGVMVCALSADCVITALIRTVRGKR
ncbi:hypothetical protein BKA65DRAFT_561568 [Rhexocercosporidium sp. MPI-PUGE-AT-0058]|nr:hypothetical protein BKA65DRAFT_561568 [Rhexocercosporidium sp. MPI-PUGE-AT-0058]